MLLIYDWRISLGGNSNAIPRFTLLDLGLASFTQQVISWMI